MIDAAGLARYLRERHGCRSVLLYGSCARGEEGPDSDIDVMGFRDGGPSENDTSLFDGRRLDAWIKPVSALETAVSGGREARGDFLHVAGGIPLADPAGLLARLLEAVERDVREPVPMDPMRRAFLSSWCRKMLERAAAGDPEGDYRLHWLLKDSLEIAYGFLERYYPGPKAALRQLAGEDPQLHARFVAALRPGASLSTVRDLVDAMDRIGRGMPTG